MNQNKRNIILLVVLGLLIFGVYLWLTISDNNKKEEEAKKAKVYSGITKMDDYELFMNIANIIDDLNMDISNDNTGALVNKFSKDYLNANALNSSNIIEKLNPTYSRIKKYVVDSYYNCNKLNCYVFVKTNGKIDYFESVIDYIGDEYYLIVIDLGNNAYEIKPLEGVTDLKSYANNYHIENVTIYKNGYNLYEYLRYEDKMIVQYYLNYTEFMLYVDPDKALNIVNNYNENYRLNYLNTLENGMYSYKKEEIDNGTKYRVTLLDGSFVTIYDYAPMNYKISLN